jgi:hypothetical protein
MGTLPWWRYVVSGVVATLTMDVGSGVVRALGLTAGMPPHLVGRWFSQLLRGRLVHKNIAEVPPIPGEMPLALAGHYLIGISLTTAFLLLLQRGPIRPDSRAGVIAASLAFGVFTNVLPWLLMFPATGFGWLGAQGPREYLLLRTSLVNHVIFGVGLALATSWVARLPAAPTQ